MEKVEIKRIVLKLSDKEVSLTIEEAKKLKELLGELFGKDIIKEVVKEEHHYHDHYRPYWYYPPNNFYCGLGGTNTNAQQLCGSNISYATNSGTLTLNATC